MTVERVFCSDGNGNIIAGEHILQMICIGFFGEQAYHRYDHQAGDHAESTGVDGALQHDGEQGLCHGVGQHHHSGEQEACPATK